MSTQTIGEAQQRSATVPRARAAVAPSAAALESRPTIDPAPAVAAVPSPAPPEIVPPGRDLRTARSA